MPPRPRLRLRLSALPRVLVAAALLAGITAPPRPSWADPPAASAEDKKSATALKKQGDDAMTTLRYADALDAYTKAYDLTADPALLYNRGRAFQGLGQLPEALAQLELFDQSAPPQLKAKVPALGALIAELRGKVATVTLSCNVKGARVLVDNKVLGKTPLDKPLKLNAGEVTIQVELEGYFPFQKRVKLPGGEPSEVVATLSLKSTMGVLLVASTTKGARVLIDGKPAGNVPVEVSVKAGLHAIRVEREGFESITTSAVVVAGDRKQVNAPLAANRPIVARWWFWTGIGAAVAGGIVLSSVLLIERPASQGTLPPKIIPTP